MRPTSIPFTDILVPLDGSDIAERALRPALTLAERTGVPLRVIMRAAQDDGEAAAYLDAVADRHAGVAGVETTLVRHGSVPDAILEGVGLDTLVCMSSHGRGRVAGALLGGVADALLRTTDLPVLVVGPRVEDIALAGRVVACLDGSSESERVLEPAHAWAAAFGLPLWLVGVAEPGAPAEWTTAGDAMESAALARLAGRLPGAVEWETFHSRHPARELVERSASAAAPTSMLVMASHGRTGWDRLRLGSVTAAVVHDAPVPVLVVPAGPSRWQGRLDATRGRRVSSRATSPPNGAMAVTSRRAEGRAPAPT